jgi:hypothetical protein
MSFRNEVLPGRRLTVDLRGSSWLPGRYVGLSEVWTATYIVIYMHTEIVPIAGAKSRRRDGDNMHGRTAGSADLAAGCWLLAAGCWLLAAGCLSLLSYECNSSRNRTFAPSVYICNLTNDQTIQILVHIIHSRASLLLVVRECVNHMPSYDLHTYV